MDYIQEYIEDNFFKFKDYKFENLNPKRQKKKKNITI